MKAIVIGGGIGGLSCAIALRKVGWEADVYEKSAELTESGAGIVLAANAMKALERLGAADQVRAAGAAVGVAELRRWDGKLLTRLPVEKQALRYGTPSYLVHRGTLQRILYEQATAVGVRVYAGKLCAEVSKYGDGAEVRFSDGTEVYGDVVIGADGYRSAIREQLFGHAALRYSGYKAVRGIARLEDARYPLSAGGGFEALGPGTRFGFSHLGEGRIFWFAAINAAEGQGAAMTQEEHKQLALRQFEDWYAPVPAVVEATPSSALLTHAIYDLPPLKQWSKGYVTLLGDAAHPMLPNLGQGGAQAMEDALVLANTLRDKPAGKDLVKALQAYEQARLPRVRRIVAQSRMMGRMMQLESPLSLAARNLAFRLAADRLFVARLHPVVGYVPPAL